MSFKNLIENNRKEIEEDFRKFSSKRKKEKKEKRKERLERYKKENPIPNGVLGVGGINVEVRKQTRFNRVPNPEGTGLRRVKTRNQPKVTERISKEVLGR